MIGKKTGTHYFPNYRNKSFSNFNLSAQSIKCCKFAGYDWKKLELFIIGQEKYQCKENRRKKGKTVYGNKHF